MAINAQDDALSILGGVPLVDPQADAMQVMGADQPQTASYSDAGNGWFNGYEGESEESKAYRAEQYRRANGTNVPGSSGTGTGGGLGQTPGAGIGGIGGSGSSGGSSGGLGYSFGGPGSTGTDVTRTELGGMDGSADSLGRLSGLLGIGSGLLGMNQQQGGTFGQDGGGGLNIPGIQSGPGMQQQQQPGTSSFGGLINNQPQNIVQGQPGSQPIQTSQPGFSISGAGVPTAPNPLFQAGTQNTAGGAGGSSFGGFSSSTPGMPQQQQQQVSQPQQQQPISLGESPFTDLGEQMSEGALGGPLGGVPAVGSMPGMNALGQAMPTSQGSAGLRDPFGGGAPVPEIQEDTSPEAAMVKEADNTFIDLVDPDNENITMSTKPEEPTLLKDGPVSFKDPDNKSISMTPSTGKTLPKVDQKGSEAWRQKRRAFHREDLAKKAQAEMDYKTENEMPIWSAFKQGVTNTMVNIGGSLVGAVGGSREDRTKVQGQIEKENAYLAQQNRANPKTHGLGTMLGEIAPYAAMRGVGGVIKGASLGSRILQRAGRGATSGGVYGGTQYAESGKEQIKNALLGGAMGAATRTILPILGKFLPEVLGGVAGAGYGRKKTGKTEGAVAGFVGGALAGHMAKKGVGKLIGKGKGITDKMVKKQVKEVKEADINPQRTKKALAAAKDLDVKITPGEATQSPLLRGQEGRLTPGKQGILDATKHSQANQEKILSKMNETIKSVLPEGASRVRVNKVVNKMYDSLYKRPLSSATKSEITKDATLQKFMKDALNPKVSKASKYPKNSTAHLIETEKFLKSTIKGGNATGLEKDTVKKIQTLLDGEFSRYAGARKLAQKSIINKNLTKEMESIGFKAGADSPVGDQMFDKFFGSVTKQKNFIKEIKMGGGDAKTAVKLARVMNSLKASTFQKILPKDTRFVTPFDAAQGPGGTALSAVRKAFVKQHDSAMVRMLMNPNYADQINKISKAPAATMAKEFQELIGRVTATEGAALGLKATGRLDVTPDVKAQVNNWVNPDSAPEAVKVQHEKTPMVTQLPRTVTKEIVTQAKDPVAAKKIMDMSPEKFNNFSYSKEGRAQLIGLSKKYGGAKAEAETRKSLDAMDAEKKVGKGEAKIAEMMSLMSPKEFKRFSSSFKGRKDLLGLAKKYGGAAGVEKLKAMFSKADGGDPYTGSPKTIMEAIGMKMKPVEAKPKSLKPLSRNATPAQRAVRTKLLKAQASAGDTKLGFDAPGTEIYSKKSLARIKSRRQSSQRQQVQRGVSRNQQSKSSSFSARLMTLILSYLMKDSKVKTLLGSSGLEGDAARLILPELQRKARGG